MDNVRPASSETYFFRDQGQFDLLRLRLLPELLERHRGNRTLRIWSAGCATGEEAYSLAMLVDMLMPQRNDWDMLILGSDIESAALERAASARYGSWSFRAMPASLRQRYFHPRGDEWELHESIRRMVSFRQFDLVRGPFPDYTLCDMDLIVCRNVFIYFDAATVTAVAAKLAEALSEGGYLMTGHTELIGHAPAALRSRLFAEGVVYQSPAACEATAASVIKPQPPSRPSSAVTSAPATMPRAAVAPPADADSLIAEARRLADAGDYVAAQHTCQQALAIVPLSAPTHFLLAQLAQIQGDFEQAAKLLDKVLYLDPTSVAAHLELSALCERTGNLRRAQILRRAALDIVRGLPGEAIIEAYETSAADLGQWLATQ